MSKEAYFKTSDISLCAALVCKRYQVSRIDQSNRDRVIFIIKSDECLRENISSFFNYGLQVDALSFFNALKDLKTRIHHA